MPDDELMQAYANGHGPAFETLYRRHSGNLFRFVRRVLGAPYSSQADEAAQDTWMKIIAARHRFTPGAARWKTWAFAIAHNTCLDRLRKSGREIAVPNNDTDEGSDAALEWIQSELSGGGPSSEDTAHWRAAGQQLMHCLDALPPSQRVVFLMHHEDECSLHEMAAALEIAAEAAKSRLRYAMAKLRNCMAAYLNDLPAQGDRV